MALVLTAVVGWFVRHPVMRGYGRWLDVGQTPHPAEAALILNGDFHSRPFEAALQYRRGNVKRILVTGLQPLIGQSETDATNQRTRRVLTAAGVPEEAITPIATEVRSTYDEALVAADWLREHPGRNLMVITNDYHTRRARGIFHRVVKTPARIQFVSAQSEGYGPTNWWRHEHGFMFYGGEAFKIPLYELRYGWPFWLLVVAVVATVMIGAYLRLTSKAPLAPPRDIRINLSEQCPRSPHQ